MLTVERKVSIIDNHAKSTAGIQLAACEMMDDLQMQVVNKYGTGAVRNRTWVEEPTLFLKFSGTTDGIKSDVKRVGQLIKPFNAREFIFAKSKQEEKDLWAVRKESLFLMVSNRPEGTILWSTDVAVPLSRLAEIIGKPSPPVSLVVH